MPNTMSKRTEGMFVFLETKLNRYEKMVIIEIPISRWYGEIPFMGTRYRNKVETSIH
jgi:hypothetical protein